MPFLHDDSLLLAIYQAQQMADKMDNENDKKEEDRERLKRIINYKQIKQSKSYADTYVFIIGLMFVAAVVLFAFYAGAQVDQSSRIQIYSVRDSPVQDEIVSYKNKIKPISYVLYLNPDEKKGLYTGLVKIKFMCEEKTSQIVLNSVRNINITKVALKTLNTTDIDDYQVTKKSYNTEGDKVYLDFNKPLVGTDEYHIFIGFHNNLTSFSENGLYFMTRPRVAIIGTLEKNRAQTVFPCFTSRANKANMQLILQHHHSLNAISNMPLKEKIALDNSDRVESYFEETPIFSTSMLTFVLTKLNIAKTLRINDLKVNFYSPIGREEDTSTANSLVKPFYNFYANTFGNVAVKEIDYVPIPHLPKQIIGSYGIVLMREEYLLFNEQNGSPYQLEKIAKAVAQGVNSQWFLDFASTETCYSIIEAIKLLLSYAPIEEQFPSWQIKKTYFLDIIAETMKDDSFNEKALLFKKEKVAAVMQMMIKYIGNEKFTEAIKEFLEKEEKDSDDEYCDTLTTTLTKISNNFDFMEYFNTWKQQRGFPLLSVQETELQFKVDQKQFLFRAEEANTDTQMLFWRVPIQFLCNSTKSMHQLITPIDRFGITESCQPGDVYLANANGIGYYHTNYEESNWNKILEKLQENHSFFTAEQRVTLLNDIFALAFSGDQPMTKAMEFTTYLDKEDNDVPYYKALSELQRLRCLFKESELDACFQSYIYKRAYPIFEKLYKASSLSHIEKKMLSLAADIIVTERNLTDNMLLIKLDNIFLKWVISRERNNLPPSLKYAIAKVGIQSGNHYEWKKLLDYYKSNNAQEERDLVLYALAQTNNVNLLQRYLVLLNSTSSFDPLDRVKALSYLCLNKQANSYVRNDILKYFSPLYRRQKTNVEGVRQMLENCYGTQHSLESIEELTDLSRKLVQDDKELISVLERIKSTIKINMKIMTYQVNVKNWFEGKC